MASNQPLHTSTTYTTQNYTFPRDRLRLSQSDASKQALVLIACGSFSPVTHLHLRMFEMASDFVRFNTDFEILGGLNMCNLAVQDSSWLMVDSWEAVQPKYMPTALVLDHFDHEINEVLGGAERPDGTRVRVKISLLAGADLVQTMSTPVWSPDDLDHILRRYGAFIIERTGTDIDEALAHLQPYQDQIYVIPQLIQNDISSTKIRLFLRREMSIQYLLPSAVIEYIYQHGLYEDDGSLSVDGKGKSKGTESPGPASPAADSSGSKS